MSDIPEHNSTGLSAAEADAAVADLRKAGFDEARIAEACAADGLPYTAPTGSASLEPTVKASYDLNYTGLDLTALSGGRHVSALDADVKQFMRLLDVPAHEATSLLYGM